MSWVFDHSRSTLGARLVLLAVANHADREGNNSRASVATLGEEAHLSERKVRYALRQLEELGEIKMVGRHGKRADRQVNVYALPLVSGRQDVHPVVDDEGQSSTVRGAVLDRDGGQTLPPNQDLEPSVKERERDPAFDALAEATGHDLKALTGPAARTIGVMLAEIAFAEGSRMIGAGIRAAHDEQLAEQIRYRAERYRRLHPEWDLTPAALAKHWPTLGAKPRPNARAGELPAGVRVEVTPEESDRARAQVLGDWRKRKRSTSPSEQAESDPDQAGGVEAAPPAAGGEGS